jgi:hypothetical protein
MSISVWRVVSKRVEDAHWLPALRVGHCWNRWKAVSWVAHLQGIERLSMAGPGKTLGSPWPPLFIRPYQKDKSLFSFFRRVTNKNNWGWDNRSTIYTGRRQKLKSEVLIELSLNLAKFGRSPGRISLLPRCLTMWSPRNRSKNFLPLRRSEFHANSINKFRWVWIVKWLEPIKATDVVKTIEELTTEN